MQFRTAAKWAVAGLVLAASLHAQALQSADSILADAESEAQANHRAIFVIFHASW